MRLHLDTDLAGDPDDVCALALVLGWPDVEVTGISTCDDPGHRRVGYDDYDTRSLGAAHGRLPDDLLNFHHDPLACAVAVGWAGAAVQQRRLRPSADDVGTLRFDEAPDGKAVGVLDSFDEGAFPDVWLGAVEAAQRDVPAAG